VKVPIATVRADARAKMDALDRTYQNTDGIADRYLAKVKALHHPKEGEVLSAVDQVNQLVRQYESHLLALWAKGTIEGIDTEKSLADRAKKKNNLADMLEAKGHKEAAAKQREAAAELFEASAKLATVRDEPDEDRIVDVYDPVKKKFVKYRGQL